MSGSTGTIGIASYSCAAPSSSPPRHPHPQAPCFDTDFAKLLTRHLALNPEPYIDLNPRRAKPGFGLLIQAEAFTWLCNQLSLAAGLRKLVLDLEGRAAAAVLERLNKLSRLPQLDSLQLRGMALSSDHLVAVLPRLARLTRLVLRFDWDHWDAIGGCQDAFPWAAAVCGLVNLRELRVTSVADVEHSCTSMFKGALPAAMSRLTALRCLDVLGMREWDVRLDDGDQLQLAALPALETAALRLHTLCGGYPGLCGESQVVLSRLVSLSLGLRVDTEAGDCCTDMHLPIIVAPALTELILDDIKLAKDSAQLSWLPRLPSLRRLVLKDVKTASSELPEGAVQCRMLTELVLNRFHVNYSQRPHDKRIHRAECRLRSLPAGPYLSQLVSLSLGRNAFSSVPPCLASAAALESLDLSQQNLQDWSCELHAAPVQGLHVLDNLTRLRFISLVGFRMSSVGFRRFQAGHPNATLLLERRAYASLW